MMFSFFLSIYLRCGAPASWAARHTIVCLDTIKLCHNYNECHQWVVPGIGGGKGGARGLKPPLGLLRGGLAPPQNDITPKLSFLEWG